MAQFLRSASKWFALAILGLLITAFIAAPINYWLTSVNYSGAAVEKINQALAWLASLPARPSFRYVSIAVFAFAAGAWGHYVLAKRDRSNETPPTEVPSPVVPVVDQSAAFRSLSPDVYRVRQVFHSGIMTYGRYDMSKYSEKNRLAVSALYAQLKNIGVETPVTEGYPQTWHYNLMQAGYLNIVHEFARTGLIKEANEEIVKHIKGIEEVMEDHPTVTSMPQNLTPRQVELSD